MKNYFNESYIRDTYFFKVRYKSESVGNDYISRDNFERNFDNNLSVIEQKCPSGTYTFTPYKGILLTKGYDTPPRVLAVATIRDRLVLTILKDILQTYFIEVKQELVQTKIQNIKKEINNFKYFYKIDISNFFGSINHKKLYSVLEKNLPDEISKLIFRAINTSIKSQNNSYEDRRHILNHCGLPQGLPISNILAEIFMIDLDSKYTNRNNLKYFRYVDDILIMHNYENPTKLINELNQTFCELDLTLNTEKTKLYSKSDEFNYLGYLIENGKFTVKISSKLKHEKSIENMFKRFLKSSSYSVDRFIFELNLKITGFKFDNKKYGWLFFFSQIDSLEVLAHLDNYIKKLIVRFQLDIDQTKLKTYLRTYHEILYNLNKTNYIPNFNTLSIESKKDILLNIYGRNVDKLSDRNIEFQFSRIISNIAKYYEKDVQDIS